jgi:hypothetical protein
MDQIADSLAFYALALAYPTVSGPVAAYVLVLALRQENRKLIPAFWALLAGVHVAGFFLMTGIPGGMSTPGFVACLLTPVFAASTALGLRMISRRLSHDIEHDPARHAWLGVGTFLIPLLQVGTVLVAILFAPSL